MATHVREALAILMLLVILMENSKPVQARKHTSVLKKLMKRMKTLETIVGEELKCEPCTLIEELQAAVQKLTQRDVRMLKQVPAPCSPIGVADYNKIPDDRLTSSTFIVPYYATMGRLNGEKGWCPSTKDDRNDYIQVDVGGLRSVCKVETQGKKTRSYVKSYRLSFSTDGVNWNTYQEQNVDKVFQANTDLDTIVPQSLRVVTKARDVRFYPIDYDKWPCMRIEVFVQ